MEYEHIEHTFAPVYDADSEVLILGTLPSVKSRENHFYYGHKQNRFWKVLADLCGEPVPETIEEKKGDAPCTSYSHLGCDPKLRYQGLQRQQYTECGTDGYPTHVDGI